MPWVRLDEQFAQHPKMQAVGPLGLAMQVAALCYCNLYLTDGFVSRAAAATMLRLDNIDLLDEQEHAARASWHYVVEMLEDAGLWEPVDGGWKIHDFPEYQPTREQVLAEREAARLRQLKLRKSRRDNGRDTSVTSGEPNRPRTSSLKRRSKRTSSPSKGDDDVRWHEVETLIRNGVIQDAVDLEAELHAEGTAPLSDEAKQQLRQMLHG